MVDAQVIISVGETTAAVYMVKHASELQPIQSPYRLELLTFGLRLVKINLGPLKFVIMKVLKSFSILTCNNFNLGRNLFNKMFVVSKVYQRSLVYN